MGHHRLQLTTVANFTITRHADACRIASRTSSWTELTASYNHIMGAKRAKGDSRHIILEAHISQHYQFNLDLSCESFGWRRLGWIFFYRGRGRRGLQSIDPFEADE